MSKFRNYDNYEIYADGRIWSYKKNKFLKPNTVRGGYQQVCLIDDEGKRKMYYVHRIVWEAVTGEPIPDYLDCNHIDEDKTNCSFANLNLLSPKENCNWGSRNDRIAKANTNGKCSKQVGAYKDGKLVMVFQSTNEAGRQGFHQGAVSRCCNGKLPHYKGFVWRYI